MESLPRSHRNSASLIRRKPRNMLSQNQRMNMVSPLVRKHRLQIAHMPKNRILQRNSVSAHQVARQPSGFKRDPHIVSLGERRLSEMQLAFVLEPSETPGEQLGLRDFGQNVREFFLNKLE